MRDFKLQEIFHPTSKDSAFRGFIALAAAFDIQFLVFILSMKLAGSNVAISGLLLGWEFIFSICSGLIAINLAIQYFRSDNENKDDDGWGRGDDPPPDPTPEPPSPGGVTPEFTPPYFY